ncbi:two-component sensor histidine kinase [Rubellimicrobium rubrum]|uniref:histidine kinase n=2 Tax=Rubellimicrobium rubrum TaxID=2585369 RepID=A0A5C4MZU4_9RHOB|nr:two-component sensor histidine kinase [Rubellimicrobium rubrum]
MVARHEISEVLDGHLEDAAALLLPLAIEQAARGSAATSSDAGTAEGPAYVLLDAHGQVRLASPGADPGLFAAAPDQGFASTSSHRLFALRDPKGAGVLVVAEPLQEYRDASLETGRALLGPLLLLVPASLLGVLWILSRALAPVDHLRRTLETRGGTDLSPLGLTGLPRELAVIAQAADDLLARLRRTLEAERAFTADAAHELRTPVAAALAQAQRLSAEAPPGLVRTRAEQVEAQLRRLARLSGKLLELARAEGGGMLAEVPADPTPVLRAVVEEFRRAEPGVRIVLRLPQAKVRPSSLDPDALAILVRNLVENALRHGKPGGEVLVTLEPGGTLSVANDGPVVPPERLAGLTRRFARGTGAGEGSGLGLAIVGAIAQGADLRLELRSPALGRSNGFEARLSA